MADWLIAHGRTIELIIVMWAIAFALGLYVGVKNKMDTCKDCIYYKRVTSYNGRCIKQSDHYLDVYVKSDNTKLCPSFKCKEDSWESVSK